MALLAQKNAVIMGASSPAGMGAAIAGAYAAEGARVLIGARRAESLAQVAEILSVDHHTCDATDEANVSGFFEQAEKTMGSLQLAVFATGHNHYSPISKLDPASAAATINTQLLGGLLFIKHAARLMLDGGVILMISSLTATLPAAGTAVYAGTKAALEQIIRIAAIEYAEQGIRINGIAPGMVRTEMTDAMFANPGLERAIVKETPMGRLARPSDIASAALWLAQDDCFVTGATLPLAGGAELTRIPTMDEIMAG